MSSSTELASMPTVSSLYKQGKLHQAPVDSTLYPASSALNAKISLIQTDITKLATTCIVNAANQSLLGGGGVDGAIHAAAGPDLYKECFPLHGCEPGSAKITSAYELPSKQVIHAVGPIYAKAKRVGGESRPKELLEGCYHTSLDLAAGLKKSQSDEETSIAFSCISTGVYGYPSVEAAGVASRTVRDWLDAREQEDREGTVDRVIFCCFLDKDVKAYEEWLPKIFPPTDADLPSNEKDQKDDGNASPTGNTQTLASTNLATEPATKKQKRTQDAFTSTSSSSQLPPSADAAAAAAADDKEDWEAVERSQTSLASSTIESTTTTSETAPLDESTVHVDAADATAAGTSTFGAGKGEGGADDDDGGGALENEEGVEVEKPRGLEEDEGVKVEIPKITPAAAAAASGMGKAENMLGKDW